MRPEILAELIFDKLTSQFSVSPQAFLLEVARLGSMVDEAIGEHAISNMTFTGEN